MTKIYPKKVKVMYRGIFEIINIFGLMVTKLIFGKKFRKKKEKFREKKIEIFIYIYLNRNKNLKIF